MMHSLGLKSLSDQVTMSCHHAQMSTHPSDNMTYIDICFTNKLHYSSSLHGPQSRVHDSPPPNPPCTFSSTHLPLALPHWMTGWQVTGLTDEACSWVSIIVSCRQRVEPPGSVSHHGASSRSNEGDCRLGIPSPVSGIGRQISGASRARHK